MFISKYGSKRPPALTAVVAMVAAAAIALLALSGCSGSTSSGGADQKEKAPGGAALADLKAGTSVTFGSYEQDGKSSNGSEPIEWRVLSIEDDKALLVSEYGLDCMPFDHSSEVGVDWSDSDLKEWLEGEFANEAFSSDERSQIAEVTCLNIDEAKEYFSSDRDRMCTPTKHAISKGVLVNDGTGACKWWLRSVDSMGEPCGVDSYDGHICDNGIVDRGDTTVRPALLVNL